MSNLPIITSLPLSQLNTDAQVEGFTTEASAQVQTEAQAPSDAQGSISASEAQAGISGSTEPEFREATPEVPNPVTEDGGILWQGAGQADEVFPGASALYARIAELEDELDTYIHKFAALEQKVKSALSHIGLDVKKFF